jgi:hypothetical protein
MEADEGGPQPDLGQMMRQMLPMVQQVLGSGGRPVVPGALGCSAFVHDGFKGQQKQDV